MKRITHEHPDLRAPTYEGLFAAIMTGTGEAYLSAYAIFLGASAIQAGFMTALPPLIGSLFLLFMLRRIIITKSRRKLLQNLTFSQALVWFPIAFLFLIKDNTTLALIFLTLLIICHYGCASITSPIWNSLLGDIVPSHIRGTYFGARSKVVLFSTLLATILGGVLLQWFESSEKVELGYLLIFLIAGLARICSSQMFKKYPDPESAQTSNDHFSFAEFLKRSHRSNFLKFTTFVGIYNLTVFISTPFIAFYLLNDLQYSYLQYMFIVSATTLFQLLTMQRWGMLSDEFGTKRVMIFSCVGYALVEFLWLFSSNFWYVLITRSISGVLWAGFALSSSAFIFDSVTPQKRLLCVSYQNVINNFCIMGGTLLGAAIIHMVPFSIGIPSEYTSTSSSILILFFVSGSMRLVALTSLISFAEVREVPHIRPSQFFFRFIHLRPFSGSSVDVLPFNKEPKKIAGSIGVLPEKPESDSGV
jgi:MFS family permease